MALALALIVIDITFVVHAAKSGRTYPWAFIIVAAPLIGVLAYIVVELMPDYAGRLRAQEVRARVATRRPK